MMLMNIIRHSSLTMTMMLLTMVALVVSLLSSNVNMNVNAFNININTVTGTGTHNTYHTHHRMQVHRLYQQSHSRQQDLELTRKVISQFNVDRDKIVIKEQEQQEQEQKHQQQIQNKKKTKEPLITDQEADRIFDAVDVDQSGTIDLLELTGHFNAQSYTGACLRSLFSTIDSDGDGTISREEFRSAIMNERIFDTGGNNYNDDDVDAIFDIADTDASGSLDLQELITLLTGGTVVETTTSTRATTNNNRPTTTTSSTSTSTSMETSTTTATPTSTSTTSTSTSTPTSTGSPTVTTTTTYPTKEIQKLFSTFDQDGNGEISREEFRVALQQENWPRGEEAPRGYFLNAVAQEIQPLSVLGKLSQQVETIPGPMKKIYDAISTLFHIDTKEISKLGVSFALSYSILSNISGAVSFTVAWYISCTMVRVPYILILCCVCYSN